MTLDSPNAFTATITPQRVCGSKGESSDHQYVGYVHALFMRAAKALGRLYGYTGLSEPPLLE